MTLLYFQSEQLIVMKQSLVKKIWANCLFWRNVHYSLYVLRETSWNLRLVTKGLLYDEFHEHFFLNQYRSIKNSLRYVGVSQQTILWNWKILAILTFRFMARTHTLSQRHVSTCLLHSEEIQAQFHYNLISVFTHRVSYTLILPVQ